MSKKWGIMFMLLSLWKRLNGLKLWKLICGG